MRTFPLLRLGVLAAPLLALQPGLAHAGQLMVLTADQLDGIVAGLTVSVDAVAEAKGDVSSTKTTTRTNVNEKVGIGVAVAIAKGSDCALKPTSCSATTSGSFADGTGKVRTIVRTLPNGTKISVTIVFARNSV